MKTVIQFKLVREGAQLPKRATPGSGAFDIYAPSSGAILPGQKQNLPIGFAHQLKDEFYMPLGFKLQGLMIPRSGLATKQGIRLFYEGLIDHDYRGEIHVCLENTTDKVFAWQKGDRLCQVVYILCWMGEAEEIFALDETQRGEGGFGSTGR